MFESIAVVTLFAGLLGIIGLLIRKIPVLKRVGVVKKKRAGFPALIKKKARRIIVLSPRKFLGSKFLNIFFQKLLSKIKILSLRIETECNRLLEKTREKTRRGKENEKYWEKISKLSLKRKKRQK